MEKFLLHFHKTHGTSSYNISNSITSNTITNMQNRKTSIGNVLLELVDGFGF